MNTTANPPIYDVVRAMVLSLPKDDRERLRREVYDESEYNSHISSELEFPPFGPGTKEEAIARAKQAEQDYRDGKCKPIEQFFKEVEEKYPWLSE